MSKLDPFISIVVPSYNRANLIGGTIKSLQRQEYDNYEIIVVDDGSTDNTEEVIRAVGNDKTVYIKKNNAERAAARNFGARMANGEYINFFDSDDLALPNHLSEAAATIKKFNSPEWFHLGYAWATPEEKVFKEVNNYSGATLNQIIANGNPLSCNGVFIRKDVVAKHSFNEDRGLSASEDYELWVRLTSRFPLYYSNVITSLIIDHEMRSVRRINGEKLIQRLNLLLHYLQKDQAVITYFGKSFNKIKADCYSYIALHLAEMPLYKRKSCGYLFNSIVSYPGIIKNRRFYAIIKNLLIKWQNS